MRWFLVAAVVAMPVPAAAQIADQVRDTEDGTVRFSFATKQGVEICDHGIRIGERRMWWSWDGRGGEDDGCRTGVAEVELMVRDGRVREVEVVRALGERARRADDLGEVAARDAASYLLGLAREGRGDAAEEAILPAMLADAGEVWRELLDLARDRRVGQDVRKSALFWLGQEAADAATAGLQDVALDDEEDQEVREAAVFALSQRPADEAIPILIEVAETAEQGETRRKAMFWLAQMEDDRVVTFFERVLLGRVR